MYPLLVRVLPVQSSSGLGVDKSLTNGKLVL